MANFRPPTLIKPGQMPTMPNMADIAAMITNTLGAMSAGTPGRKYHVARVHSDGSMLATGGVESKANIDIAAMMSGAMNPKRQKGKEGLEAA